MSSINLISNVEHREKMLYDIRYQIGLWNDVAMHDGAGKLINFYEVASDKPKPSEIDGHRVIEILQDDLTAQRLAGVFNYLNYTVKLCYKHTTSEIGYNPDTMVHELGHVLGLEDIDGQDNVPSGTHKTLMGYNRGTDYSTIDSAIAYQDIQGVAVLNNIHTNHSYQRYIFNGNEYLHICFYCDRIDSQSSALAGINAMNDESTCTHNFMPLVSAGERHWLKCTECYKVIESDFYVKGINNNGKIALELTGLINENSEEITIPNQIAGLDVVRISNSAFKGCSHLARVELPYGLLQIGNNAFENCTALTDVTVNRYLSDITSLGSGAFLNCNNLTRINVPINRIADYKNEAYWSTYKTLIHPSPITYTAIYLNDSSNINKTVTLSPKWNKIYELNVLDPITYTITSSSTQNVKVKLYDENMNLLVESSDHQQTIITRALANGTYYYSVEYCDASSSGSIKTTIVKKHIHSFNSNYEWINYTSHRVSCSCGSTITQEHVVSTTSIMGSGSFTICLLCGGRAKLGNVQFGVLANQIQSVTENGSMILPNGIIVLAYADREDYFNGTLVFYDKYKLQVA